MVRHVLRRLAWMVPTLFGITLLVFVAAHLAPGDPALWSTGGETGPTPDLEERLARFRAEHLLDRPLWRQYLHFVGPFDLSERGHALFGGSGERPWHGLLALDLGHELHRPGVGIADEIARRLRVTLPLALVSILLAYGLAIPLGILAATRRGTLLERTVSAALFGLHSVPTFWAGLLLVMLFGAAGLGWLPATGTRGPDFDELEGWGRALDLLRHALLPVATLTLGSLAYLSRQLRGSLLEALASDYVRTARAKGLPERVVVLRHALRNSLLPLVTLAGAVLPALIGGSVVVETVFGLQGMGSYAYEALLARDYNVILAATTLSAVLTLLGILLADLAYGLLDPRIRPTRHG